MADRIPFRLMAKMHRTLAEVNETEYLRWQLRVGLGRSSVNPQRLMRRLEELTEAERRNNPPSDVSPKDAA